MIDSHLNEPPFDPDLTGGRIDAAHNGKLDWIERCRGLSVR